jgi:hypothetical protein
MSGELWLPPEPNSPSLRPSFIGSGKDHRSLEFRQRSKYSEDQLSMGRRGVNHRISQASEPCTGFAYGIEDID